MNAAVPTFRTVPTKKIRKRSRLQGLQMRSSFFRRHQRIILLAISAVAGTVSLFLLIRRALYGAHTRIDIVEFSDESKAQFITEHLQNYITSKLVWNSSLICSIGCTSDLLRDLRVQYPFLEDIDLSRKDANTMLVSLTYAPPRLVFQLNTTKRATYEEKFFQLSPLLSRGQDQTPVYLPRYLGTLDSLDALFFKTSEATLINTLHTIYATLRSWSIDAVTYIPWWEKLLIEYNKKSVYLDLTKNIDLQLTKLVDLEQYYEWFPYLLTIDLGSSEYAIIK